MTFKILVRFDSFIITLCSTSVFYPDVIEASLSTRKCKRGIGVIYNIEGLYFKGQNLLLYIYIYIYVFCGSTAQREPIGRFIFEVYVSHKISHTPLPPSYAYA